MEIPKDYSSVYCEDHPVPAIRSAGSSNKTLDGSFATRRHKESLPIDPNELSSRLFKLTKEQTKIVANHTLQQHYTSVFQNRGRQTYKVYINYFDNDRQKETYLVRINKNTLRDVKSKLPIKGEYRLFFIHAHNECEEVEDDDSHLPYHEKDGALNIYCRVFPR